VTRERVREDLRSIFDEVSSGPSGVGTGPMSVLKYSPEMSRRAIPLFNYVRNDSILPQRVRELAMLTTARAKDCPYIWNAHAALGRQAGLRDDLIDALRDRMALPPMAVEEAVVIKLGMEFFQTNRVSQETFDVALTQFGPQGLVELTTLPDVTAMRPILSIFIPGVCGAPFGVGGKRSTLKHPPFATSIRLANIS
jgi:4-carboxymuconolactone decarboxylase